MKCRNCQRVVDWTRRHCPACRTKLPAWYVIVAAGAIVGVYVVYKVVEMLI